MEREGVMNIEKEIEKINKKIEELNKNLLALSKRDTGKNNEITDVICQNKTIEASSEDLSDTVDLTLGITENNKDDIKLIAEQSARLNQITLGSIELTEEQMLEVADLYPLWQVNKKYEPAVILKWGWNDDNESQLYQVLQQHISQEGWEPDKAPSLFKKIGFDPESGYPIWSQPVGASDAWQKDDIVEHKGKNWISTVDNNVWEPGVYGWVEYKE